MTKKYQIKNKSFRMATDLTKYDAIIIKAVHEVVGESVVVRVTPKYFEIDSDISNASARKIGLKISYYCPEIRKLSITYISKSGTSKQIFMNVR